MPAVAANPDPAQELVARYHGTWDAEVRTLDTAWSKAQTQRWTIANWCSQMREFYACRQTFNGGPPTLTVYSFTPDDATHSSVMLGLDGKVLQSGSLTAHGETLTFPWEATDTDGTRRYFRILNTWRGPDCIDFRKEVSTDGTTWHLIASGLERRAGSPTARGTCNIGDEGDKK